MEETKIDGWNNLLTGLGGKSDASRYTNYSTSKQLSRETLGGIYRGDGIGRKIVDVPVDEMFRQWIKIENDDENLVLKEMINFEAKKNVMRLFRWARLYGGAGMVVGADDGGALEEPLRREAVRRIRWLRVYDRHQITWTTTDLENDSTKADYGKPNFYNIQPINSVSGTQFRVHKSRILIADGEDLPDLERQNNQGWGDSSLESCYQYLRQLGESLGGSERIIRDFVQTILQVEGLQEMIAAGQEDLIKTRVQLLDLTRSIMNTIFLDSKEKYERISSSVSGLDSLLEIFMMNLSGVTNIPATKLFGRAPQGMNSTGEGDLTNWYDFIKAQQEDVAAPILEDLVELVATSLDGPFKGKPPEGLEVKFNSLFQLDEMQVAARDLQIAQRDMIYLNTGVLDPEEVRESRFGGGSYSTDTHLIGGKDGRDASIDAGEQPSQSNAE